MSKITDAILQEALQATEPALSKSDAFPAALVAVRVGEDGLPEPRCVIVPASIMPTEGVALMLAAVAQRLCAQFGYYLADPTPLNRPNPLHAHRPSGHGRGKGRMN